MDIKLFLFLFSITVLPLTLIFQFSPWEIPQIQYLFLGLLLVIRIVFFRQDEYKKNIKMVARERLRLKIGRVPSDPEIIDYIEKILNGRNVSFVAVTILTFFISVVYGKFI